MADDVENAVPSGEMAEKSSEPQPTEDMDPNCQLSAAALAKKKKKEKEKARKEKEKQKDDQKNAAKKKPKTTTSDLIKEAMKIRLEEEEKARKKQADEDEKLKLLEEQRLQKLKEEKEKKERKKQKEKEKIERLKKEGKFLTVEQKQKLARQREMVEQLQKQGLLIGPSTENDENQSKWVNKQKNKISQQNETSNSKEVTPEDEKSMENSVQPVHEQNEKFESVETDDVAESWDMLESDEEKQKNDEAPNFESSEHDDAGSSNLENLTPPPKLSEKSEELAPSAEHNKIKEKESVPDRIKRRVAERLKMKVDNEKLLRSPVICVLGHVDTGKTKILDKIRQTHVQDAEAGGITQQIGATFVPGQAIKDQGKMVKDFDPDKLLLPGFLIIDTPGHESFSNLRLRGSSLCDIAILVVDIMHGLEPQTIESLNMLKKRKTPFVIALNKVDRLYEWKANPRKDIRNVLKSQQPNAQIEFQDRFKDVQGQFAQQGLNVALFWENKDYTEYVSIVPTSAHSGDGMGNLMCLLAQICQNQHSERLTYCENLQCSVLEVKSLPGLGTTIDVILLNGRLHVGDSIIVAGMEGPIVTQIRELLMPQPMREMRVKNPYEHYKELMGAQGIKILAKDLDKALAGMPLLVAENEDEIDHFKDEVSKILEHTLHSIKMSDKGVYVQASTLGSLEALLDFLRNQKIPYSGINIGPVHKKDVMKASAMLEHDVQWAVILAFDVKIERESELIADELGVKIFHADIIYHLQDAFVKYREELRMKKRHENQHLAIFPCKLRVLPQHVFKTRDPIVVGVSVDDGIVKVGTPICVPSKEYIFLGTVSSIEINQKPAESARKGQEVAIKIENTTGEAPKMYGRHFDYQDLLVSKITRETIDVCKQYFREDLQKNDWQLIVELKKIFGIL